MTSLLRIDYSDSTADFSDGTEDKTDFDAISENPFGLAFFRRHEK